MLGTGISSFAQIKSPSQVNVPKDSTAHPIAGSPKDTTGKRPGSKISSKKPAEKQDADDSDFAIKHPTYKIHLNKPASGLDSNGRPIHSSRKAWMLSTVIPGAGQIYNHRYWKLPIIYGGMIGVIYGIDFNQKLYNQTLQYYKILLVDPAAPTLPTDVRLAGVTQVGSIKDYYRRNRDLFAIGGAALLLANAVDAYVDSELKGFDVSNKLTLHIGPSVTPPSAFFPGSASAAYGLRLTMNMKKPY